MSISIFLIWKRLICTALIRSEISFKNYVFYAPSKMHTSLVHFLKMSDLFMGPENAVISKPDTRSSSLCGADCLRRQC